MSKAGTTFRGYKRLTHHYALGWEHLDEHEYLGDFRVLNVRYFPSAGGDYDDLGERVYTIRAPRLLSEADIRDTLVSELSFGCRCQHDCCGHAFAHVYRQDVKRVKRRRWVVRVHVHRNV
ncbi:hypothetical protein WT83_27895 [Burkholderia territorii]|uniref:Uncharacterized protein n=1 Tax=Burkholderia territorii TaxID=1503055 RepID=A0A108E755_9BURK|nr:hypothetical protein [Burkholderia territorii]KWN05905.1 hypothetical protein WT83_27895 [Burkholderia territorii]